MTPLHIILANPHMVNINYGIIKQIIYLLSFLSFFGAWFIITLFVMYAIIFLTMITIPFQNNKVKTFELVIGWVSVMCLLIFWNIANIHITHHLMEEYKHITSH
jgi:hypothetical protein